MVKDKHGHRNGIECAKAGRMLSKKKTLSRLTQRNAMLAIMSCLIADEIQGGGIFLYKTPNQAYRLLKDKVLLKLDWAKNQKTKSSLKKTVAFADEGNSNSDTNKIIAQMDAMIVKMDAQYKELQSRAKQLTPDLDDDDMPMSREEEAKFMKTFHKTRFYNDTLPTETQIVINWVQAER
ncbi:hypothetical protein Tco_0286838 [Tanacetum coccineum]